MKLFTDDLLNDTRDPFLSFGIPFLEGDFGLFAPRLEFWKQILGVGVIVQLVQAFCAILSYHFIVSNRNTTQAYLFGWAVVIPFVTWLPFQLIEHFELQNVIIKMCTGNMFIAVVGRTIEAMYGTAPPGVESTLATYIEYYLAGCHHILDPNTKQRIPSTSEETLGAGLRFATYLHLLCLSTSLLMHVNFAPFESPVVFNEFHFNTDLLHPGHLGNSYLIAIHNFFYIGLAYEMLTFVENLKGWSAKVPFRNPLWASTSPTDFWGRRWNMVIHEILKGGAFRPARKFFPAWVALFCAFLLSGVIHDFVYAYQPKGLRDPETGVCEDCYSVQVDSLLSLEWNDDAVREAPGEITSLYMDINLFASASCIDNGSLHSNSSVTLVHWGLGKRRSI